MRKIIPDDPSIGDERIRSGFLILSKTLTSEKSEREWRWMEYAYWVETWMELDGATQTGGWMPTRWLTDSEVHLMSYGSTY